MSLRRAWSAVLAAGLLTLGGLPSCGSQAENADDPCLLAGEGCACPSEGVTAPCAETLADDVDSVTCRNGERTCRGGRWGACVGEKISVQSHPKFHLKGTTPAPCVSNPCDPGCMTFDDVPGDIDAGGAIVPADGGGITIGEGGEAGWVGGSTCTGLQCQVDACSGDYTKTQLTGKVYDPAGKNPLYNVLVYVPNASLAPLTDGVTCDACSGGSGSPIVSALTDYTGSFTLKGVPSGTSIPLVIQSGKWRRQLTLPSVTKCAVNDTTALTGADGLKLIRFPKNRSEGSIPRIAFVSGGADPFQCVFKKMGIDVTTTSSEVGVPVLADGSINPDRIHYYRGSSSAGQNLSTALGGGAPSSTTLWASATRLNLYDAIIFACEGNEYNKGTAVNQALVDYAGRGGRLFLTHYSYAFLQFAPGVSKFPNTVNSWDHSMAYSPVSPMTSLVNMTFPKGDNFARWLNYVGASPTLGRLAIQESRRDLDRVNRAYATPWMYSNMNGTIPGGGTTLLPTGSACTTGAQCASGTCTGGSGSTAIANGGFESGLTSWTGAGAVAASTTTPKTGTRSLQLGSSANTSSAAQTFTAPAGGGALTFSYRIVCTDVGYDNASVMLRDNTAGVTTYPVAARCSNGGWESASVPLVGGRSYTLTFQLYEFPDYIIPSYLYVDDVMVGSAGTCAAGTTAACTTDAGCGAGWSCWNGICIPPHDMEALMTFNVPVGAAPAAQCGRVVFSDFHVSASALSGTSSTFPDGCKAGDLSAQEKALEFMLFDLTACLTPDYVPPATPSYAPVTVSREYVATCPKGSRPTWHYFDWKSVTPGDSKISFKVRTGETAAAVAAMTPLALATVSGPPITSWVGADVATLFAAQTPKVAHGARLLVDITLTPTTGGTTAPTLVDWRQSYTCVPTE
ncbi:MAG: hypothetical protein JNL79_40705 [Myxococcales bacterium]|nr:hypothetical protein [Myxococcales bacterium]